MFGLLRKVIGNVSKSESESYYSHIVADTTRSAPTLDETKDLVRELHHSRTYHSLW